MSYNILKVLPSLFASEDNNGYDVVESFRSKVTQLGSSVGNANSLMKERAGMLAVRTNETSALLTQQIVEFFSNLADVKEFSAEALNSAGEIAWPVLRRLATGSVPLQEQSSTMYGILGYTAEGKAVHFGYQVIPEIQFEYAGIGLDTILDQGVEKLDWSKAAMVSHDIDDSETVFGGVSLDDVVNIDDLQFSANEKANTNSFFYDVLVGAAKGKLSVTAIQNRANEYGNTSGIKALLSMLFGSTEVTFQSLLYCILKIIDENTGDADDDGFVPYDKPNYCTDVFAVVWEILSTIIKTVLTVIFQVLSTVLAVVWTLVTTLFSFFSKYVSQIQASVKKVTEVPVWNYPLSQPFDIDVIPADAQEAISEMGVCYYMVTDPREPLDVYGYVAIYPDGHDQSNHLKGKGQVLIPVRPTPNYSDWAGTGLTGSVDIYENPGEGTMSLYNVVNTTRDDQITTPRVQSTYEYLSHTNDLDFRRGIWMTVAAMLNLFTINYTAASQSVHLNVEANSALDGILKILSDNIVWPTGVGQMKAQRQALAVSTLMYLTPGDPLSPNPRTWDDIEDVLEALYHWNRWGALIDTWFANLHNLAANYLIDDEQVLFDLRPICYNNDLQTPAADTPNLSVSALITAAIVSGLAIAATITATAIVKRQLKVRATAKISEREEAFKSAQEAYHDNPSAANRKALYKANRKLTRSWKMANRLGVSTYNGFSTGSDIAAAGGSGTDSLDTFQSLLFPEEDLTSTIYHKITGDDYEA